MTLAVPAFTMGVLLLGADQRPSHKIAIILPALYLIQSWTRFIRREPMVHPIRETGYTLACGLMCYTHFA